MKKNVGLHMSFVLPALMFYLLFVLLPISTTFFFSLTDWDGASPSKNFIGLENYWGLLKDGVFFKSLLHNILWIAASITVPVAMGLLLAVMVSTSMAFIPAFYRVVYFLPAVLSSVVVGIIWDWIYNPSFGLLNSGLSWVGLGSLSRGWLGDPQTVLACLIAVGNWSYFGFCMVIFIAGLQSIDPALYEAADLDGAGSGIKFFAITIPLLRHVTSLLVLNSLIGSFKVFDLVYVMTRGGPFNSSEVIATYMFRTAFTLNRVGYGSAIAMVMAMFVIACSCAYLWWRERDE